jgi:hypothetical protein
MPPPPAVSTVAQLVICVPARATVLGLKECHEVISRYEAQSGMDFETFRAAWEVGQIAGKHTHSVERDLMELLKC